MASKPDFENDLLERLTKDNPARRITGVEGSRWGRLMLPAPDEADQRPGSGLRVLCIGSWTLGLLAFETSLSLETKKPGRINLVGLVTDDPLDFDGKISLKKRFWRYYEEPEREQYERGILHRALSCGILCFTGEIKSSAFRDILSKWAPEAIMVAAFGQVIDEAPVRLVTLLWCWTPALGRPGRTKGIFHPRYPSPSLTNH